MERDVYAELVAWKRRPTRKPLLLTGARQVGKTWLMEEFGRREFASVVKLSFNEDDALEPLLFPDRNARAIIDRIAIHTERDIDPESTLLIFDEIQDAPNALASLKSFAESAPEFHVIAAGSLLGLAIHQDSSFPVGKVSFVDVHPLTFSEFLRATGRTRLDDLLATSDLTTPNTFAEQLTAALKSYHLVGGMPEAVAEFVAGGDYARVQRIQDEILRAYDLDVSKHSPPELVPRIRKVLGSMPEQLAQEKKRFIYSRIEPGARSRSYEQAIQWLADAGIVTRVAHATRPLVPLGAYEDDAFKLFFVDIGLLARASNLAPRTVLEGSTIFTQFKDAMAEQFVLQEFLASQHAAPHYWSNERNTNEVDFLIDVDNEIVPVEVKAEHNRQSKSLRAYVSRFAPEAAVRLSLAPPGHHEGILDLPLYAAGRVADILRDKHRATSCPSQQLVFSMTEPRREVIRREA